MNSWYSGNMINKSESNMKKLEGSGVIDQAINQLNLVVFFCKVSMRNITY